MLIKAGKKVNSPDDFPVVTEHKVIPEEKKIYPVTGEKLIT